MHNEVRDIKLKLDIILITNRLAKFKIHNFKNSRRKPKLKVDL